MKETHGRTRVASEPATGNTRSTSVDGATPRRRPSSRERPSGPHRLGGNSKGATGVQRCITACRQGRFFEGCPRCGKGASICRFGDGRQRGLRHPGIAPPGLACQAVEDGSNGNAANPGWHELQHTRSRHAEQTVEVVRNHEGGTSRKRGSELPKGVTLDLSRRQRLHASAVEAGHSREWTRDGEVGGRARANESQERRTRRESGSAVSRRSEGEAKSTRAASRFCRTERCCSAGKTLKTNRQRERSRGKR